MEKVVLRKNVVIREGVLTHCYLVFNHYGHSLEVIKALADVARQDFPMLTDADMSFKIYRNTGNIDRMLGCEFALPKDCQVPSDYSQCSRLPSY